MKHNKPIKVLSDLLSAAYTRTTLIAAEDMPAEGTLRQKSKYVIDQLKDAHPEIAWGVDLVNFTPGKANDTTYLWKSSNASEYLSLLVGDDLYLRIFALKSKTDEAKQEDLINTNSTDIQNFLT